MPHFPIAPELPVMLPLWQQPDFAVVHLPAKSKSTMPALKHKLLSVRLLTPPLQQNTYRQLSRLLAAAAQQRVEGVVFSTAVAFGVDDVQHLVHSGYHACGNVSLVGCFAKVDAWESVPIKIERGATNFTLMDTAASMRGNSIVVFGDLSGLRTLDVHADCDVHIIGQMGPNATVNIRARSLTSNGVPVPVVPPTTACGYPQNYHFSSVPPPVMFMPPLCMPQPRKRMPTRLPERPPSPTTSPTSASSASSGA